MSARPRVSVIMRTKNSATTVGQALAALFSQEFRDFDVLVVDSGSTDATLEIVDGFPCRVLRIAAEDYYPGPVLNRAISQTVADIIVFQNSDTVPLTPRSLGALVAPFDEPRTQATFGRQIPRPEAHTWVRRDYRGAFPPQGEAPVWLPFSLPFAAMRRAAWEEQRFYSAAWGSEDTAWGVEAKLRGGEPPQYVSRALVMHSHNYSLRQLYGRRFIEGEADAFIYGRCHSVAKLSVRFVASTVRDLWCCARHGDLVGALMTPARRWVYHWAFYRGHKLGERRIAHNDSDTAIAQRVVLDRYGT